MRTIFLFPSGEPVVTIAALDEAAVPDGIGGWAFADLAWLRVQSSVAGLYDDWPDDDVAALAAALDTRPEWGVVADVSVRATPQSLMPLLRAAIGRGGVAVDDNSAAPWSLADIERGERSPAFMAFVRD